MTARASAASATLRASTPTWSMEGAVAWRTIPWELTSPAVGLSPTTPVIAPGMRTEPAASVPRASRADPTATDAPPPAVEPPG